MNVISPLESESGCCHGSFVDGGDDVDGGGLAKSVRRNNSGSPLPPFLPTSCPLESADMAAALRSAPLPPFLSALELYIG